jgi:hypothetical protein
MNDSKNIKKEEVEKREEKTHWGDAEHDTNVHRNLRPKATPEKSYNRKWGHYTSGS